MAARDFPSIPRVFTGGVTFGTQFLLSDFPLVNGVFGTQFLLSDFPLVTGFFCLSVLKLRC